MLRTDVCLSTPDAVFEFPGLFPAPSLTSSISTSLGRVSEFCDSGFPSPVRVTGWRCAEYSPRAEFDLHLENIEDDLVEVECMEAFVFRRVLMTTTTAIRLIMTKRTAIICYSYEPPFVTMPIGITLNVYLRLRR